MSEKTERTIEDLEAERSQLIERVEALTLCISEASPHVYRQQGHGKHGQDRADAVAWWAKWRGVRNDLR